MARRRGGAGRKQLRPRRGAGRAPKGGGGGSKMQGGIEPVGTGQRADEPEGVEAGRARHGPGKCAGPAGSNATQMEHGFREESVPGAGAVQGSAS